MLEINLFDKPIKATDLNKIKAENEGKFNALKSSLFRLNVYSYFLFSVIIYLWFFVTGNEYEFFFYLIFVGSFLFAPILFERFDISFNILKIIPVVGAFLLFFCKQVNSVTFEAMLYSFMLVLTVAMMQFYKESLFKKVEEQLSLLEEISDEQEVKVNLFCEKHRELQRYYCQVKMDNRKLIVLEFNTFTDWVWSSNEDVLSFNKPLVLPEILSKSVKAPC